MCNRCLPNDWILHPTYKQLLIWLKKNSKSRMALNRAHISEALTMEKQLRVIRWSRPVHIDSNSSQIPLINIFFSQKLSCISNKILLNHTQPLTWRFGAPDLVSWYSVLRKLCIYKNFTQVSKINIKNWPFLSRALDQKRGLASALLAPITGRYPGRNRNHF